MTVIHYPLSGGRGMQEVSLYADYADQAFRNLIGDHPFETIAVCSIGLDVLLNTLPDRLLLFSSSQLDETQRKILAAITAGTFTAGKIIKKLKTASVLDRRLLRAFQDVNTRRNKIVHPFQGGKLKAGALFPSSATRRDAESFFRRFCHVIDLAGGRSPLKQKRQLDLYIKQRRNVQKGKLPLVK